jgi:nucleotide-binding universal stress UspA family protein
MDFRTFVVPYDFSSDAEAALGTAATLARRLGASLHLVHVVQPPIYAYPGVTGAPIPVMQMEEIRNTAAAALAEVAAAVDFGASGTIETDVVEGASIAEAVCATAASLRADLIVMGTHGRTGWSHVFLGSVAERTLRQAPCPVVTVRAPAPEEA